MDHRHVAGRFNARVGTRFRTLLLGGAAEPLYLPASGARPALIRYTRDYAQSALHEIAHWLVAAPARRGQVDYGYWYQPPPRSPADQQRFYAAEAPVQALEMLLCLASSVPFGFSADNPGADGAAPRQAFETAVRVRFQRLLQTGAVRDAATLAALEAFDPAWRARAADERRLIGTGA